MKLRTVLPMIFCVLVSAMVAEVVDSASNGFTVKTTLSIKAGPDVVYRRIIQVGEWWDPVHTYSHDSHNLTIEEKPMGCWCEKLPNQGSVRHMEVLTLMPGKTLVMSGGIGPLQSMATAGSMTINLSPEEGGTKLEMTYAVGGYLASGLNTLAPIVDSVLGQQFSRLKNYVEHGKPAPVVEQPPKP